MRIHIFGASGSGTTTLGKALASRLQCAHFDSDDYYWLSTDTPFLQARQRQARQELLLGDLSNHNSWVLSGSLCGWGDVAIPLFGLAVFLWLPTDIRLARLEAREIERYGEEIVRPQGIWCESTQGFLDWAAGYDTGGLDTRSLTLHEAWMASLPCRVTRLEGDISLEDKMTRVLSELSTSGEQTRC